MYSATNEFQKNINSIYSTTKPWGNLKFPLLVKHDLKSQLEF